MVPLKRLFKGKLGNCKGRYVGIGTNEKEPYGSFYVVQKKAFLGEATLTVVLFQRL